MNVKPRLPWSLVAAMVLVVSSHGILPATAQQTNQQQIDRQKSNLDHLPEWAQNSIIRGKLISNRQESTPAVPNVQPKQDANQDNTPPPVQGGDSKQEPPKLDDPLRLNLQDQKVPDVGKVGQQAPGVRPRARPAKVAAEKYAGWREAGEGFNANRLNTGLRSNWIMVDPSGRVDGRIVNYAPSQGQKRPMKVHLLNRGLLVNTADVSSGGTFGFSGLKQTTYTLIGISENQFFAFSFDAIQYQPEIKNAPTSLGVSAMPAPVGFTVAWLDKFAPLVKFRNYGVFETKQTEKDPARLYGLKGLSTFTPKAAPATSIQAHTVSITKDGRVLGRVHQIDSLNGRPVDVLNTTIAITDGTDVVAHTSTDNYGVFEFKDLAPGNYGLFAAGTDGVGAMGIQVVAYKPGVSGVIDFSLATSESIGWINHTLKEEDYLNRILQPRPRMNSFNPACGGECGWCSLLRSLYGPQRDYSKSFGCHRDNKLFHQNCRGGNCEGGCQSGGCTNGGCNSCGQGGCQSGGCSQRQGGNGQCGQCQGCQSGGQCTGCGQCQGCQSGGQCSNCQSGTGGCQSGQCQNGQCQKNNCGCGQNRPHPCLGAAFKKCPECDQYRPDCRCNGRQGGGCSTCGGGGCSTCRGAAFKTQSNGTSNGTQSQGVVQQQNGSQPNPVQIINLKK